MSNYIGLTFSLSDLLKHLLFRHLVDDSFALVLYGFKHGRVMCDPERFPEWRNKKEINRVFVFVDSRSLLLTEGLHGTLTSPETKFI